MVLALDSRDPDGGLVIGELNKQYLWGLAQGDTLPPLAELCILDGSKHVLFSSFPVPPGLPDWIAEQTHRFHSGHLEWAHGGRDYLAGFWPIFLKSRFFADEWNVLLVEAKADVLAPASDFRTNFPAILIISFGMVLLLSIRQIRKQLLHFRS